MEGISCDWQTGITDTYSIPLFQCFADRKIQIIVYTTLDQGDNVDCFKNIVDKTWEGGG